MATRNWLGTAAAVAQVTDFVFGGTWEADDVITLTIGAKTITLAAGSTDIATIIASLTSAWNALDASVYPEFAEITASDDASTTFTLTGDTAGVPFTCTIATDEAGGGGADAQTIDSTTSSAGNDSTACSGPNFWSVAANWSGGAVPVNSDDVILANSDVSILYGLAQSAVTLTSLRIDASYTGEVGLAERNADGSAEYDEYRATYLAISATTAYIGRGEGQGSQRLKLDTGSVQTLLLVSETSSGAEQDVPAMLWKGTHASNVVRATGGSLGIAFLGGEAATVATLAVSGQASVSCGTGVTHTTVNQTGGALLVQANATTITSVRGELVHQEGTITTLTLDQGATADLRGTGTITTLNAGSGSLATFSNDERSITVTNCNVYAGASVLDPGGRATWSNPIALVRCGLPDVQLDFGQGITLQPA